MSSKTLFRLSNCKGFNLHQFSTFFTRIVCFWALFMLIKKLNNWRETKWIRNIWINLMKTNKAFSSKRFKATKFMTKSLIQTEDYLIILISKNEIYIIIKYLFFIY